MVNYKIPAFFRLCWNSTHCVETSIFSSRHQPHKRMANSSLLNYAKFESILDYNCRVHRYILYIEGSYSEHHRQAWLGISQRQDQSLCWETDMTVTRPKVLPVMDWKTILLPKWNTELSTVTLKWGSYKVSSSNFTPSRPLAPSMT